MSTIVSTSSAAKAWVPATAVVVPAWVPIVEDVRQWEASVVADLHVAAASADSKTL